VEFIQQYPVLKWRLSLSGIILSFDQGMGKTLTAVGLAECLGKQLTYVVCPNTLRENWLLELKKYYARYDDPAVVTEEIYVHGLPGQAFSEKTRWVVVNNEAIEKAPLPTSGDPARRLLIVDEGQNFRNFDGLRTKQLIKLKERLDPGDVLPMSGTPIKASPNEIVPVMMLIDPMFDVEAARQYNRLFAVDGLATAQIVRQRFGLVIHRKTKALLGLPPKKTVPLPLAVEDPKPFLLAQVQEEVTAAFGPIFEKKVAALPELLPRYKEAIQKYSKAPEGLTKRYLSWVEKFGSQGKQADFHELTQAEMDDYNSRYVVPNVPREELSAFNDLYAKVLQTRRSAMGEALGSIIPGRRRDMFLAMWRENLPQVLKMVQENPKKAVFFSVFPEVARRMAADLDREVGCELVVGGTADRQDRINRFREDDSVGAIAATSQTMQVGVTLVEANILFFFGTPWRSTDMEQASDRIHRIGQTDPCTIWVAVLSTSMPNLSSRMQDILNWSAKMFGGLIDDEQAKTLAEACEAAQPTLEDLVRAGALPL
jgi:hypothetical protein